MNITNIRVKKLSKENKIKGIASITFDDSFVIHDIKIIEGDRGLFIAMPSRKSLNGEYKDIAHPINSNAREVLQKQILEVFENTEETI